MNRDIMTDEFAARIIENGHIGKLYSPSNGIEGEMFMEEYCYQCDKDSEYQLTGESGCEILSRALCFNIKNERYPKEWIYNDNGQPTCTAFIEMY